MAHVSRVSHCFCLQHSHSLHRFVRSSSSLPLRRLQLPRRLPPLQPSPLLNRRKLDAKESFHQLGQELLEFTEQDYKRAEPRRPRPSMKSCA